MLTYTNAQSSFSVDNIEKAKEFYGKTLGLKVTDEKEGMIRLHVTDNTAIMVYPKPNHTPATFTVLNFMVKDIEKTVDELTSKGIAFEHYDFGEFKTNEKGIIRGQGPTIAWFTDPAKNVIAIIEEK